MASPYSVKPINCVEPTKACMSCRYLVNGNCVAPPTNRNTLNTNPVKENKNNWR